MSALDKTVARFGLRVVVPAVAVLIGAIATVVVSMREMAGEVNRIEVAASERAVVAAVQSTIRRLGETNRDYANWDDAVRNLYGKVSDDFVRENFQSSTATPIFFDTAFLVDDVGRTLFGVRLGERLEDRATDIYGASLAKMIGELPTDARTYEVRSGIVASTWGLAVVAVGPVTPVTPGLGPISVKSRYLILSKAFDEAMLARLSEDFLIDGLRALAPTEKAQSSVEIADPSGKAVAALTWAPRALGSQAQSEVSPVVLGMLALVSLTMILLIVIALRSMREVQEREQQSRYTATHDGLTGLPNRAAAIARIDEAIAAMRNGGPSVSVVYVDLTGFKAVNDAYGHETGDRILTEVAAGFTRLLGTGLARVGGDEYVAIVQAQDSAEAARDVAWQFIALLAAPFDIDGRIIMIGASVGIATAEYDGPSAEELMRRADVAMYQAKQQGGNRIFIYDSLIDTVRHERLELSDDLRKALKRDELSLAYQPVFAARSRTTVTGVEALIRWVRPNFGDVPPSVFIPVAEEAGLIDELGIWALRRACRDALAWPSILVSVNVSPAQLRNPTFDTTIRAILKETGLPPDRLELEVTESYFMANPEQARRAIDAVRSLGVSVALDDFGTGYSSIGYLKAFTFDKLKLDRSMITGIGTELRVQRLVHATIALADALDLSVTAEGVETEAEATLLSIAGCRELQGFYLARPGPAAAVTKLLAGETRGVAAVRA